MKHFIFILLLLFALVNINAQTGISIGDSVVDFVRTYNSNLTGTSQFFNLKGFEIWNNLNAEHRLSIYSNDSLRNKRFIMALTSDNENRWKGMDRLENFIFNSALKDNIKYFIINGDIFKDWAEQRTKAQFISVVDSFYKRLDTYRIPILITLGNHESNSELTSDTTYVFFKRQQRAWFIDSLIQKQPSVEFHTNPYDADGCYYYVDDNINKIRILMTDIYDVPQTTTGSNFDYVPQTSRFFSGDQLKFIADSVFNLPDAMWQVVMFHHPTLGTTDNSATSLVSLINAFKSNTSITITGDNAKNAYNITVDYSSINNFNGVFVAAIYGHGHEDYAWYDGFWKIEIPSMRPNSYMTSRVLGTSTEDCADFLVVDKLQRQVRLIRYGAGANNYQTGTNIWGDRGIDTKMKY